MAEHKHHMIRGWIIGKKELEWICDVAGCRASWVPHRTIRGLWRKEER